MAYKFSAQMGRWMGLSTDTKPDASKQPLGELLEELNTGAVYINNGTAWKWREATKELDHNRAMLGLGLSYQSHSKIVIPNGQVALYRFNPSAVTFHHAERRVVKAIGGDLDFFIYRGHDIGDLPTIVNSLDKHNQLGLNPADENSVLTFDYHGQITLAAFDTLVASADEVDSDWIPSAAAQGNNPGNPASSSLPSGRHYEADTEYLVAWSNSSGDATTLFYSYGWHEG